VGDDYVLNGEKCWITNASLASFYVVFATSDPTKRHKGIAAFIVDRDTPGLKVGKHEDKMGQRASDTAAVHFEDVKVPKRTCSRPRARASSSRWRPSTRRAPTSGDGHRPDAALPRRMRRLRQGAKTFGVADREHQLVQAMLAEMAISTEATRLLYQKAAWNLDTACAIRSSRAYAKASVPTARCRARSTRCRSSAATATSGLTRSKS
jgi:acyl-CoA dehydrogenase